MSLDFKFAPDDFGGFFRDETFRGDFTYRNSNPRRFPFPFDRDDYMYSGNMEPHVPGRKGTAFEHTFDVDEHYVAEMIDRARAGKFAYPAVNITSSQSVAAALQGFAEAESDGIIQVSVGGAEYASGSTIKDRVSGSLALAAYASEGAKLSLIHI